MTIKLLTCADDLRALRTPRPGELFRVETTTGEGAEVYNQQGVHIVDDSGDTHGPFDDEHGWRRCLRAVLAGGTLALALLATGCVHFPEFTEHANAAGNYASFQQQLGHGRHCR